MRLTDLQIKKLKPPDKGQRTYFDEALRGFGVRVSQGGAKSFVVMFGKTRRLKTIGRYPGIGLADARRAAKLIQGDPSLNAEAEQNDMPAVSFNDARARFLADTVERTKERTADEYRRLLNRHFTFDKSVDAITRGDVMGVI